MSGLLGAVLGICDEDNYRSSLEIDVANCIYQTPALINRVALTKDAIFKDECEQRIYINEHFGGRSANQRRACRLSRNRFQHSRSAHSIPSTSNSGLDQTPSSSRTSICRSTATH